MIGRKARKRMRHILTFSLVTLLLNSLFPVHTTQAVSGLTQKALEKYAFSIKPATQLPVVGTRVTVSPKAWPEPAPIVSQKPVKVGKRMTVRATAYSSTVDQTDADPFTTASGQKVRSGIIAMNGLKFGTKVRIPQYYGNKVFVVQDRMARRWGMSRIDIWMPTRADAIQWGIRTVTIEIVS
jgi:3D (Asp-Asp-Asp) domain-containing protein